MVRAKKGDPLVRVAMADDVEIRHVLYPDGEVQRIYRYKGNIIPRIPLTGHYIEQCNSLDLLDKDLRNVIEWLGLAKEIIENLDEVKHFENPDLKQNLLLKSLFVSTVTIYGKCFTEAKGRRFMLERKHIPDEFKELHDTFMKTRHNFAAHKGEYKYDTSELCLLLSSTKRKSKFKLYSERNQINYRMNENDLDNGVNLCNALRAFLHAKKEKLIDKILEEKIHTKSIEYWMSRKGQKTEV